MQRTKMGRSSTLRASWMMWLLCQSLVVSAGCGSCADPAEKENEKVGNFFEPRGIGEFEVVIEPQIEVVGRVDFGALEAGAHGVEIIEVSNTGRAPLEIEAWQVSNDAFVLSFPDFMSRQVPKTLAPGERVRVRLDYTSEGDAPMTGELLILSNDPKRSEARVELTANVLMPCIHVDRREVDFGAVAPGEVRSERVVIRNCSEVLSVSFRLTEITQGRGVFEFANELDVNDVISLRPGLWLELNVEFSPPEPDTYTAQFEVVSEAFPDGFQKIELSGLGAPYRCPSAVLRARNEVTGSVVVADPRSVYDGVPLDFLSLDSTRSFSEDGSPIVRTEWTLVQRPPDSGAAFSQGVEGARNGIFLDLTGEYQVEMHVWNARGMRSCEPAVLDIEAIPDEDVHIQLVWDTPNDNNQFDSFGSDVDLHLLRQGGVWNSDPWDCFWQNLEPDWGKPFDGTDNPSLDIDDTDGWGPENINLNNPEEDLRYHVGVHYFSDQGFGTSYATVRLYLGGRLEKEYRRQRLRDQQFWHVADIDWSRRQVVDHNDIYGTFPSGVFSP